MTTMDGLIEEILAEMPDPSPEGQHFIDLNDRAPHPVGLPKDEWVEILTDAKDEFEVDGAAAAFSTWRVEVEDPLDIGDVEIADGMRAGAGRLALDAWLTDDRVARLLAALPEDSGVFILRIKFLREHFDEGSTSWVVKRQISSHLYREQERPESHRGILGHKAWRSGRD